MSGSSFSEQIRAFAKKVQGRSDATVRVAALDLASRIIDRTPVKTGRAKANWRVTLENPANSSLLDTDPGGGSTFAKAASTLGRARYIQNVYIANNVEYIVGLEYGKSKQAPAGMVRISVAEWDSIVAHAAAMTAGKG